jgi:tetratricopeptide (TPR) repeat protein
MRKAFCLLILLRAACLAGDPGANRYSLWKSQMEGGELNAAHLQYAGAEAAYAAALETAAGLGAPDVYRGITLNSWGVLCQQFGKLLEAEKFYLRSMALLENVPGVRKQILARSAANLASLYFESHQDTKAEHLLLHYVSPEGCVPPGPDGPVLLSDLASLRARQGRFDEAETLFHRVKAFLQSSSDPESREEMAIVLSDLSDLYKLTNRYPQALDFARRALDSVQTLPNPMPLTVIKITANAAAISELNGEFVEAADLYQRAIHTAEADFGTDHPLLGDILTLYGKFLRRTGHARAAAKVEKRTAVILAKARRQNRTGYTVEAHTLSLEAGN